MAKETQANQMFESLLDIAPFCTVALPESWRTTLEQGKFDVPLDSMDYFYPFAVAADGSRVFGTLHSDISSGVVAVTREGEITHIRAFDNPHLVNSAGGAFDGRWLVWSERHGEQSLLPSDIHAWDSTTGDVIDLATAASDGSVSWSVLSQGRVAWSRWTGTLLDPNELHVYALADRQDMVVSNGKQLSPIAFVGTKLLVSKRDTPGSAGNLALFDPGSGQWSAAPLLLATLASGNITTSAGVMAWPSHDAVFVWRSAEPKAKQIYALDPYAGVPEIGIADELLEWGGLSGTVIADLRSGSAVVLGDYGGPAYTNGTSLMVSKPLGPMANKGDDRHYETDVVDVSKLPPLPKCPS